MLTNSEKPRGGSQLRSTTLLQRINKIARALRLDTRRMREQLICELKALFEMAQRRALDCPKDSWKEKQNWTRIAAYVTQVINSIGNTYDLLAIEEDLTELGEKIDSVEDSEKVARDAESNWRSRAPGGPTA